MTNFSVNFTNAWWLLLLIPAFGLTLFSYFRLNKRYRYTRNRIASIVLHLVVMVLSIALLAGLTFQYFIPNNEAEVILLVDSSYTMDENKDEADLFVKDVIRKCNSMYKLGIVKFGYDQVTAVELTNEDMDGMYSMYLSSPSPDTTATDLAAALSYAADKFTSPSTARIVLLSDALETDGHAKDVVMYLASLGIAVDSVNFEKSDATNEVQIVDAVRSTQKVEVGMPFTMDLTIESTVNGKATITPYDNNNPQTAMTIDLKVGTQKVSVPYNFAWGGLHVMSFEIKSDSDTLADNNSYYSYVYIEEFKEVLVIEKYSQESKALVDILKADLNVKVLDIDDENSLPDSVDALRLFDEVILVNVSNADLSPSGLDKLLHEYVYTWGGGLFTICGNKDKPEGDDEFTANAYEREDMYGKLYQEMLPVEIIDYTAPVGVIIVVDSSGSMIDPSKFENSKLYYALEGARSSLDALTDRDYVGIMTLADSYTEPLALTPRTQRYKILEAITELEDQARKGTIATGGTLFSPALERAGLALAARTDIEKKHIIIVTDGEPAESDRPKYEKLAADNAEKGITMSIVCVGDVESVRYDMEELLTKYAKCPATNFHGLENYDVGKLPGVMREELMGPQIKSVQYEKFQPEINGVHSVTNNIKQDDIPNLYGYYGVKIKPGATVVLSGKYTPLYAQWDYGRGRVGTFACNLYDEWSGEFMTDETGQRIMRNIVNALFPTESIRIPDVEASYVGDNYTTTVSIFTDLADFEKIRVTVTALTTGATQEFILDKTTGYSRLTFAVKEVGVSTIFIEKLDAEGNPYYDDNDNQIECTTLYKALSYSKEYDEFADKQAAQNLAQMLAAETGGYNISNPDQVFEHAVEYLHIIIDPRIVFAIIIIVAFLLDIAARKFKWKWPHEIIQERKRLGAQNKTKEGAK